MIYRRKKTCNNVHVNTVDLLLRPTSLLFILVKVLLLLLLKTFLHKSIMIVTLLIILFISV